MRLLGRWNWWVPSWLDRAVGRFLPRAEAETEAAFR
jgi:hypothetical protein